MKRLISLILVALSFCAVQGANAMCGHVTLTSTSTVIDPASQIGGRHGICVQNTGATNAMSFSISNNNLPTWLPSHVYPLGYVISDGTNIQRVSTSGTSGTSAPTWATSSGSTTSDGTVTWTVMQVGVAAIAADFTLLPTAAATASTQNAMCMYAQGNALLPGGAISALSASGTTVSWCAW